jgi:hypothetical protein
MANELDKRYQTLVTLWFALLVSVGMYLLVALFVPASGPPTAPSTRPLLTVILIALGVFLVLLSFVVKSKLLERSVAQQDVSLVQKSLIIACAMCEATALLGLLEHFLIGATDYFLLFILAAAGMLFHFPRRLQLEAATYKTSSPLNT